MTYKTILAHCDASPKIGQRLDIAAELARRHSARLVGVHVRTPIPRSGLLRRPDADERLFAAYEAAAKDAETAAVAAFAKATKGNHLPIEWRVVDGDVDEQLALQARYADLLVLGQTDPQSEAPAPPALPELVVLASGRPALVVPYVGASAPPGRTVMLCWNASRESARAASDALPLFKEAEKVIVLLVDPQVVAGRPWRRARGRCRDMAGAARHRGHGPARRGSPIPMSAA